MDRKEIEKRIAFSHRQFEIHKLHAMRLFASATTGVSTLRNTSQGREPNEEEKAKGLVVGWRPHTDMEKIQNDLDAMTRHIQFMNDVSEGIVQLQDQLDE